MSTIIESINKITEIKQDLNQILRDNGLEGGDVFADYPDKFRELFRVITSMTDATTDGYKPSETDVATVVPAPSLRQYQNVVYVTNNMEEATIYYYVNTDSGNHNIGLTRLEKGNSIIVSEPSTVYVYAQFREIKSTTAQIYVPWNPEVVPDPPVIVRNGITVTMTCNAGDEIFYATGSVGMSEWQKYEGPITVERYENIWAFAQNYRGRSDTIFDEAPEPLPLPDTPIIQCNLNVVEITCGTEDATIYYKKQTDKYYIEYTGPFSITQSDYYEAKAMKDGLYGGEAIEYCRYVEEPTAPVISCADNAVTITCEPATETVIYYKIDDGEWQEYNGPILLTETVTITAYGNHYGVIGPSTTQECVYVAPIDVDEPEFSQIVNTVSITCDTEGADIWYRIDNADVWSLYEGPIDIDRDMQIQAYATVGNAISDTVTYNAQFIDAEEDAPAAPVGSCTNNVVTITCDTPNAEIYYRDINDGYWTKYEGEFLITESHTYVIYSTKYGLVTYGTPFEAVYDESSTLPTAPNPAITYNPANHSVTITCSNPQATIYYSLDSGNWDEYTGPFEITADGYVYAYSKITGWRNSSIVMKYCRLEGDEPVVLGENQLRITNPTQYPIFVWFNASSGAGSINQIRYKINDTLGWVIYKINGGGQAFGMEWLFPNESMIIDLNLTAFTYFCVYTKYTYQNTIYTLTHETGTSAIIEFEERDEFATTGVGYDLLRLPEPTYTIEDEYVTVYPVDTGLVYYKYNGGTAWQSVYTMPFIFDGSYYYSFELKNESDTGTGSDYHTNGASHVLRYPKINSI